MIRTAVHGMPRIGPRRELKWLEHGEPEREIVPALANMVAAARVVRDGLAATP